MGSKSSSSKTTQNIYDTDNYAIQDNEGITTTGSQNRVYVEQTDHGAIDKSMAALDSGIKASLNTVGDTVDRGFDFGRDALAYADNTAKGAFNTVAGGFNNALSTVTKAYQSDSAETLQTLTKWMMGGLAVVALAMVFMGGRK